MPWKGPKPEISPKQGREPQSHDSKERNEGAPKGSIRIFNFRHSIAEYKAYSAKLGSEQPSGPIDIGAQPEADLTEKGIELAQESAGKFFDHMNPDRDVFYIVSSTQTRAIQTAKIYADVALARGFKVVSHRKRTGSEIDKKIEEGSEIAKKIGEGHVRSLQSLSLGDNALHTAAFYPVDRMPEVNWSAVDSETKKKLEELRMRTVEQHDYGSWGANMHHYAAEAKKVFPDLRTPEEFYEGQFGNLLKLSEFAKGKADNQQMNVLSFGHENYMGAALEKDTGHHALGNCEALELIDGKLKRLEL